MEETSKNNLDGKNFKRKISFKSFFYLAQKIDPEYQLQIRTTMNWDE